MPWMKRVAALVIGASVAASVILAMAEMAEAGRPAEEVSSPKADREVAAGSQIADAFALFQTADNLAITEDGAQRTTTVVRGGPRFRFQR